MPNIQMTSFKVAGSATAQVIVPNDYRRKYVALVAATGAIEVSVGEVTHADAYISIAQGNMFEYNVNCTSKYQYTGAATEVVVMQDADSTICLSSDNLMLTYDGSPLTYNRVINKLNVPVFN